MKTVAIRSLFAVPALLLAVVAALLVLFLAQQKFTNPIPTAHATTSDLGALSGYAWSDNLGWISFSGSNYQVVIQSDGTLAGYAWANPSDDVGGTNNIGWISFNATDTASCGSAATLSGTTITGWAKVLSADNNGWDGCISLNGSSPSYGVTFNSSGSSQSGTLEGYAWADSNVGGWISFNCDTGGPTGNNVCSTFNYAATYTTNTPPPPAVLIAKFISNPSRVKANNASNLSYVVTVTDGTTCTITGSDGSSYPVVADSMLHTFPTNPITKSTLFTLTCGAVSATAKVGIVPVYQEL